MIIDNLKNASRYYNVHKGFKEAFTYLEKLNLESCNNGTFNVNGNNIVAIFSTNELKNKNEAILETHQKHIDIQIPLSQAETFGWKAIASLNKTQVNYDSEKDLELYDDIPSTFITVEPGEFVIFLPEDAHAPLIGVGEIKKIIFKISVD